MAKIPVYIAFWLRLLALGIGAGAGAGGGLGLGAEEPGRAPLDAALIIDGGALTGEARREALAWVEERLLGGLLQDGDRLSLWDAGDKAALVFSGVTDAAGKKALREKLAGLAAGGGGGGGGGPEFSPCLREAAARKSRGGDERLTFLVTASAEALGGALSEADLRLLRYSRVEEFPQWRLIVAAPDIEAKAKAAAAAFMNGR